MFRRAPRPRSNQRPVRSIETLESRQMMAADFGETAMGIHLDSSEKGQQSEVYAVSGTIDASPEFRVHQTTAGTTKLPFSAPERGVSLTQSVSNRVWTITGTDLSDLVKVDQVGDLISLTFTAADGTNRQYSYAHSAVDTIVFRGRAGDDAFLNLSDVPSRVYGDDGNDYLQGGGSRDYLAGGDGDDTLNGGAGNDGLHGGAGADKLNGDAGQDRFLTQEYDNARDVTAEDAVVRFVNDESRAWSDTEIETTDAAFRILQYKTGNLHLLKDPVTSVPIVFQRIATIPDAAADNAPPDQPSSLFTWGPGNWAGTTTIDNRTPYRKIRLADAAFGGVNGVPDPEWAKEVVLHEIGHNWDSAKEIGRVLPGLGGLWNVFDDLHDESLKAGVDAFVDHYVAHGQKYGQTDVQEDFADIFAYRLLDIPSYHPLVSQRYAVLDQVFSALSAKGEWDGHQDSMKTITASDQFNEWLSRSREKLVDFLAGLEPSRLHLMIAHFDASMLSSIVPKLTSTQLQGALPRLDANMFKSVIEKMSTAQLSQALKGIDEATFKAAIEQLGLDGISNLLEKFDGTTLETAMKLFSDAHLAAALQQVDGATLKESLKRMSDELAAGVLEQFDGATLQEALERMPSDRIAKVLEVVDGATLKESLTRMSDKLAASVLEQFDGATLQEALERMPSDRISKVLERVDGATLKESLTRMSHKLAARVLEQVDGDTLKAAMDRMSDSTVAAILNFVDAATLKAALQRMNVGKVEDVVSQLSKSAAKSAKDILKKLDANKFASVLNIKL